MNTIDLPQNDVGPTRVEFGDLHAQYLSIKSEIDSAISTVIAESSFIRGRHVEAFEEAFAAAVGTKHCVSCSDGTTAIYIAIRALGVSPGDEIIVPAMSWISTSETVTQAGAKVVFCDLDPETHVMDPEKLRGCITSRTVGIIPVHLYGQPAPMGPIIEIAKLKNLWVIEDCAQAHLAEYNGLTVGTFGDAATFSFYPGKNLGAMGDAGAIVTNGTGLANHMAMFARHGGLTKGEHTIEGINSRLDGLQAAILNAKLPHLRNWTRRRQAIAARYEEKILENDGLQRPRPATSTTHVWHLYVVLTDRRDDLIRHLGQNNIRTSVNYRKALPFLPCYSDLGHVPNDFPIAYRLQEQCLALPLYPEMSELQVDYVADKVNTFFQ